MLFSKYPKNKKVIIKYDKNLIREPQEKDEMIIQGVNNCCPNYKKWIRSLPISHYKKQIRGSKKDYDEYTCLNCGCIYRIYE